MGFSRPSKSLSPECAAYIAGLIDGEGTITLSRLHANENRRLVVSIASTELQLLDLVLRYFGVGKITRKCTYSAAHTPSFCYSVSSRQALSLLRQVLPYLRSYKRQRAELALRQYVRLTPRNGKYTNALRTDRWQFEEAFLSIKPDAQAR
jgi:hypothetical protein